MTLEELAKAYWQCVSSAYDPYHVDEKVRNAYLAGAREALEMAAKIADQIADRLWDECRPEESVGAAKVGPAIRAAAGPKK